MNRIDVALLAVVSTADRPEGVGTYTAALARYLISRDLDIEIWAQRGAQDGRTPLLDAKTIGLWRRGIPLGFDVLTRLRLKRPRVLHVQFEFRAYGGATGVFSLLVGLAVARLLLGQRVIVTVHQVLSSGDLTQKTLGWLGIRSRVWLTKVFVALVMAGIARWSDAVIVHAGTFKERLITDWGVRPDQIHVIPHGVPVSRTSGAIPRESRVLVFGYIKRYKGIELAIQAFARIAAEFPDWTLTIAGPTGAGGSESERYLEELKALASPLGSQIEFIGPVEDTVAESLFARASIVLLPYRVLFSASGPMAQAMGSHTPFIMSEELRPICPEWPFRCAEDADEWARMLRGLMGDAQRWADAQMIAAAHAASISWDRVAEQTARLYRKVCTSPGQFILRRRPAVSWAVFGESDTGASNQKS